MRRLQFIALHWTKNPILSSSDAAGSGKNLDSFSVLKIDELLLSRFWFRKPIVIYSLISMILISIIWHGIVSLFLKICIDLICKKCAAFTHKIVFVIVSVVMFRNNNKNHLRANAANFLQICVNLQKYWNIAMSNYGSIIKMIDQSHRD